MMNARIVLAGNERSPLKPGLLLELAGRSASAIEVSDRLGLRPVRSEAVFDALAADRRVVPDGDLALNAAEVSRLVETFENMSWQSLVSITTLVVTLMLGVLACGQLLASAV